MTEISVEAPTRLDLVASTLRDLGDRGLNRELTKALKKATEPLKDDARRSALERLPRQGGLAALVAASPLITQRKGGRNPGVTIRAKGMKELRLMDRGMVRHPVFGNRDVWVMRKITPGWFSAPMEDGRDEARRAIDAALDDTVKQIARRLNGI